METSHYLVPLPVVLSIARDVVISPPSQLYPVRPVVYPGHGVSCKSHTSAHSPTAREGSVSTKLTHYVIKISVRIITITIYHHIHEKDTAGDQHNRSSLHVYLSCDNVTYKGWRVTRWKSAHVPGRAGQIMDILSLLSRTDST